MPQSEPGTQQQELDRQCFVLDSHHPVPIEGKQAATHDFLALCGSTSASSTVDMAKKVSHSGVVTQDLLHPLNTEIFPVSSNASPAGIVIGGSKSHTGSGAQNVSGQHTTDNIISGGVDTQSNYRSLDISYVSKSHVPRGVCVKHWQQPQNNLHLEGLGENKRFARGFSEEEDDDDDDLLDQGYIAQKEIHFQKLDNVQQQQQWQLKGKSLNNRGLTLRSKHSATEQRRRSRINDRFQMLRQLLPNPDQKRDKASFLLEVVEYIQMLHEKIRKYETTEHSGQLQEGKSGCREGSLNVSDGSPVRMLRYNVKETTETGGYMSYQSSQSRVAHENGSTDPRPISDGGHSSLFTNRLLQAPVCLPSYRDNSVIKKPTLLSFVAPLSTYTEERPTPTLFLSGSQAFPGYQTTTLAQMLHCEEQATIRTKGSPSREGEVSTVPSHLQQAGKGLTSKIQSFSHDPNHEQYKNPDHSMPMVCDRQPNEEVCDQLRSNPLKEASTMREPQHTEDEASRAHDTEVDEKLMHLNLKRFEGGDCTEKDLVDDTGSAPVLGGVVNISSPYSQGLLDRLTRALQSVGIDLAQARISVQIDLGNPGGSSLRSYKETASHNATVLPGQSGSTYASICPSKRTKMESEV